jgi:EF-hand domain pair
LLPFRSTQDLDGTGQIRYTEFLAATIEAQGAISEERLAEAFDRLDSDDSGYISVQNLSEMLGKEYPKAEIEAIIKEAASDNDGQISYAEFLALWEVRTEQERGDVIKEITVLKRNNDSERSLGLSVLSGDESDFDQTSNLISRASFLDGKNLSERKQRVLFNDSVKALSSEDASGGDFATPRF